MADQEGSHLSPDKNCKTRTEQFMNGPLVAWVRTFREYGSKKLDYGDLINGAFLDDVLSRIDPRPGGNALQPAEDICTRIRNLDSLVRCVKTFYEDVLGQVVLIQLPDPVAMGRDPDSESGVSSLQLLLLLLLGCAVQGPSREEVIEDIKKLPVDTQHAIVECIQQVADNPETIWSKEWSELSSFSLEQQESIYRLLVQHVRRVVRERDEYAQQVTTFILRDLSTNGQQPGVSNDRHHSMVELAEAKAKVRRFRQEVDEKSELAAVLQEELDSAKTQLQKLRQENMDLVQEARQSKALRDELDIVRERAAKVDRLEAELNRYKDKLNDIDYYKSRLEEMREDNRLLEETKTILEGQLETARQRAELVLELEGELLNYKSQLNSLIVERDSDKERIKSLIEENAHWQLCAKNCLSESASLAAELDSMRTHSSDISKDSLGDQMNTVDLQTKSRRLELENQRLVGLLSNLKEAHFRETAEKILTLEADNTKLKLRIEDLEREQRGGESKLMELVNTVSGRASEAERQKEELLRNNQELKSALDSIKVERTKLDELEVQVVTQGAENQKLQRNVELLQRRLDSSQAESRDLEVENEKLQKTVESLRASLRRLHELEKENTELEADNHRLDRENKGLHKEVARLKQAIEVKDGTLDEYSSKVSTLERETRKLHKECEALQQQSLKVRDLERENKELQQATTVERKTLAAIREELVQEKIRSQQLQCQVETSLRTVELFKSECDTLKLRHEESAKSPAASAAQEQQQQTSPSLELGREVLAIKDRLVELERENAVLSADNSNLKFQVSNQREQAVNAQTQLSAISQQLATLEVENSTLTSQQNSLNTQNSMLQRTISQMESEKEKLVEQLGTSQNRLEQLSRDQEELQKLHEQLQVEYDSLLAEKETLKSTLREVKSELRAASEKYETALQAEEEWKKNQVSMKIEMDKLETEARSLQNLRAEHSRLKDDFRSLFVANERLKNEYKNLQGDYKAVRTEHNTVKLKTTQLQGEVSESRHQVANLEVELNKLRSKCDSLQLWNNTLEEDKRNLVNQVSVLLTQYHELLTQTLEEKDHFHEESKAFSDKVNNLKRQKEILEDKIMEQYRKMENSTAMKKNSRSLGAIFVRKMRRASSELINRVPRSRSRSRGPLGSDRDSPDQHDGPDTFSLESGSNCHSGCASLDSGSGGEEKTSGSVSNRSERQKMRQSMPVISFDPHDSVLSTSFSSDAICKSTPNRNEANSSPTNQNGHLTDSNSNSGPSSLNPSTIPSSIPASPSLSSITPLNSSSPKTLHRIPEKVNGSTSFLHSSAWQNSQSTRSLPVMGLLERAGSRQPVCLTEAESEMDALTENNEDIVVADEKSLKTTGSSPPSSLHASTNSSATNTPKMLPNLTSTTRINVNISTPNSSFERRGSLRLPPRPAPRTLSLVNDSNNIPPLPARANNQDRPALPPKQSSASEKSESQAGSGSKPGASSIWYEYGCV